MKEIKKKGPKPSPIKSKQKSIKIREDLEEMFMIELYGLRDNLYSLYPRVVYTRDFINWRNENFYCTPKLSARWTKKKSEYIFTATTLEKQYAEIFNKSPFANGGKK